MALLSVVIPTYNEAANIAPLLRELDASLAGIECEYIVVDDASTDGTPDLARGASPNARVIVRAHERGLATAVVRGIQEAGGAYVAVMDADFQHPPAAVKAMLEKAQDTGADLVVGSRYAEGGSEGGFKASRKLVSRGAALLSRLALPPLRRHGITDPMSGLFLVRRSLVHADELRPTGYKILLELVGRTELERIEEIGYAFQDRRGGESKLGGAVIAQFLAHLARLAAAHKENRRMVRFAIVGVIGVFVNFAVLIGLKERAAWDANAAVAVSAEVSILSNFILNDRFTFLDRRRKPWPMRLLDYQLVSLLGYAVNQGTFFVLYNRTGMDYIPAEGVAILLAFVVNYGGNMLWTYRRAQPVPRPPPAASRAELQKALAAIGLFESDVIQERPWGLWVDWYRTEDAVLKCMVVRPGARMSLQRHKKRREVWRVVAGSGEDQGADPPMPLVPGKTHVVGLGSVHRIANTGADPLVIVELQMGECDEHDIERLSDDFKRA